MADNEPKIFKYRALNIDNNNNVSEGALIDINIDEEKGSFKESKGNFVEYTLDGNTYVMADETNGKDVKKVINQKPHSWKPKKESQGK